jgi:uncharacterized protein
MEVSPNLSILKIILKDCDSAVVAFSGGSDSTFLLAVAQQVLGDRLMAFTAESHLVPTEEIKACKGLARSMGLHHEVLHLNPLDDPRIQNNPPDRCYYCKRIIYEAGLDMAKKHGLITLMDGTTHEDLHSGRSGLKAIQELKVRTPLAEAGFTKAQVRRYSRLLGIPTWNKPSQSCLATRIPFGTPLRLETLRKVDQAEDLLRHLGFSQVRVRLHKEITRIEVLFEELPKILNHTVRQHVLEQFKNLGFIYVTVDLGGFESGSMDKLR